ncbi:hypothetical protein EVG20_g9550 [Dentipellis fragilis]|uniref:hAT-like transposase RNase-H fold domain-containing protein n=1 Tax=Dentipellis fragilis TaxID=205917 RepID=A0A4Y9XXK5_9AGAM|nr:hypothetical protein EVG20_g9550 [Dentipellis fragilis]
MRIFPLPSSHLPPSLALSPLPSHGILPRHVHSGAVKLRKGHKCPIMMWHGVRSPFATSHPPHPCTLLHTCALDANATSSLCFALVPSRHAVLVSYHLHSAGTFPHVLAPSLVCLACTRQSMPTSLRQCSGRVFRSTCLLVCAPRADVLPRELCAGALACGVGHAQVCAVSSANQLVVMPRHNKKTKSSLKHLGLSEQEWTLLRQLCPILSRFLEATVRISNAKISLLHEVIPVIDLLTSFLDDATSDNSLLPVVQSAAARGMAVFNKYYAKTNDSIMYRLSMILHPKYKLDYFSRNKWPLQWVEIAKRLLREQWEQYYKPSDAPASTMESKGTP